MRLISDEKAKDMLKNHRSDFTTEYDYRTARACINAVPSAQPEKTEMIKEIRKWINSGNRGSADYFIVDKIEEIINKYE